MRRSLLLTRREWVAASISSCMASCARPKPESTVTILYPESQTETVLGPYEDAGAKFLVFMPLAVWSRRGELQPRLAETWEYSADGRACTIRLRDGIFWHDGVPVTAHDMKFTLDLLQHPATDTFSPGSYAVNVIDDRTYRVDFQRAYAGRVDDWTVCWPKHILEKQDPARINTWEFWSHPVGCGPYRHVRTVADAMMEFEANPDYFLGRPKIARVILKFGAASAIPELRSGTVDAVAYSRTKDVSPLTRNHRFSAYQQPITTGPALWWNHRHTLFHDAVVRRALSLAINRRELLEVIGLPGDTPLMDFAVTERQLRRGDYPQPFAHDPELAARMLDSAGWRRPAGRKLRERNGRPFRFKALVLTAYDENADTAVYVQDQLKRLGVHMDILGISDPPLVKSRIQRGEFEAAIMTLGTGLLESFLRAATGYQNPAYFALLEKARTAFDPEEHDQFFEQITGIFQEDIPATLLYPSTSTTIAHARIRGLDGSPYRGDLTQCMDELWLEEEA
jgi:peptide/nickel transport system substrate-binding protein